MTPTATTPKGRTLSVPPSHPQETDPNAADGRLGRSRRQGARRCRPPADLEEGELKLVCDVDSLETF
ncbi:MAG: hypothetical protein NVV74_13800 [Magnetospirillum sp.]|nr:hypothetical protein [Magnetospirillum sp.]